MSEAKLVAKLYLCCKLSCNLLSSSGILFKSRGTALELKETQSIELVEHETLNKNITLKKSFKNK